jgi:hypothetical protein
MAGEGFALRQQKAPAQRSNELGPQGRYVCNGDQPSTSKLDHGEWDFDTGLCVIPSGRARDVLRTGKNFHDVGKFFPAGTHHKRTSN